MRPPPARSFLHCPSRRDCFSLSCIALAFWLGTLYTGLPSQLQQALPPSPRPLAASAAAHASAASLGSSSSSSSSSSSAHAAAPALAQPPSPAARLRPATRLQPSTFSCDSGPLPPGAAPSLVDARSPDGGGPSCVFEGLYLREGRLHFAVESAAEVADAQARMPTGYHLGHDMNVAAHEGLVAPTVVALDTVREWLAGDASSTSAAGEAVPPPYSSYPLLLFARLNPKNIYHHLWDDQMFAHSVLCRHVALLAARGEGPGGGGPEGACAPGTVPPFALALVDSFGERDLADWRATVAVEVAAWPLVAPPGARGGVARVGYAVMGTRGLCTHRRHCSNILPAPAVRLFRAHLQALHGIVTALPPPGAQQTAVLVRRTGRRVLTNLEELVQLMGLMGYATRVVGPLKDMSVDEQYAAFANASLAVFVFGAELGPAWVGLPEGSCTAVLHPAGIMDTLSYWVADKVGLKVATVVENFKTREDARLAPRAEWGGREKGGLAFEQYSDVWLWLFNHDFRLDPKDLWRMAAPQCTPCRPAWAPRLPQRPSLRGTLSQQLAAVAAAAQGVTASLQGRSQALPALPQPSPAQPCATLPALQLRVGRTCARRGAPVHLFPDRAEFVFALGALAGEVHVVIWFQDVRASTRVAGPSATFRVKGDNFAAFSAEGAGPHTVTLTFHAHAIAASFVAAVQGRQV